MDLSEQVDGDHATEISFLARRYPEWTIWYGPATGHWWALPPRERDIGDFVEAPTIQRLIASIELIQNKDPRWAGDDPVDILRSVGAPPLRRVPVAAWPGDPAR